ncbi:MAG: 2-oxoglutarate dehydrogenase, E2 component, dihydrolipoamide succinyltransferase [Acidobacteria bacterium]|nr:2-oxoglutarate dehydrogenase, E2 component, dihydrolipoamide succinyltransferase [Acidobacteriota bacterium]
MTDVVMPQMGESIVEGTLTKWLKQPGQKVERDEPLFEISTDKVDTEIPSPAAGTLSEVLVEEGKTVGINTVVARIEEDGRAGAPAAAGTAPVSSPVRTPEPPGPQPAARLEPPPQETAAPSPAAHLVEEPRPGGGLEPALQVGAEEGLEGVPGPGAERAPAGGAPSGPLSPLVRRMAREHGIDLSRVKGKGAGGRITRQDVEAHIAQAAPEPRPAPVQAPPPQPAAPGMPAPPPRPTAPAQPATRIEAMSTMRAKIAEHMVLSRNTSVHVTTVHKVDMTRVARLRERQKADFQARYGISLTYLPFVARAAVEALRAYPLLNASADGANIVYHNEINIGIAVALDNGLIVPVIRGADEKNVLGLQRAIVDLAARARSRQLKPEEVHGGTFSITNFGSFGSIIATPIINQPQVAILGVGAVEKTPVIVDDAIAIRSICYLSLSFDHRLVDGALADQFTAKVKSALESWSEEVL